MASKVTQVSTETLTVGNLVAQMATASSLGPLWQMINELQIQNHMDLFDLKIPANFDLFSNWVSEVTSFQPFDLEEFIEENYELPEKDAVSERFDDSGYERTMFLINGQNCIINIVIYLSLLVALFIFEILRHVICKQIKCCSKTGNLLNKVMIWNGLLYLITAMFLDVILFTLLNISVIKHFIDNEYDSATISNALAVSFLILAFVIPLIVTNFFCKNKDKVEAQSDEFFIRVKSFIDGARFD